MAIIQGEQRYQLFKITLDSGESLETTKEHPFYIKGKGWNPANSLKVGQALQLHNGTTVVIKEIDTSVRLEKVYNLTVANTHNYFVGEDGVLVHNCGLIDEKRVKHLFRNKEGHLPDTQKNRELLESVATDSQTVLGNDVHGNTWAARIQEDGSQVWIQSRNGKIINAGLNKVPRSYNPETGLSSPTIPK